MSAEPSRADIRQYPLWGLLAAILFGLSTPMAKPLTAIVPPVWLATIFYGGSLLGILPGMFPRMGLCPDSPADFWIPGKLTSREMGALAASILFGGVLAPIALIVGLTGFPASRGSLLMNAESLFTVLIATFLFREKVTGWILTGVVLGSAGCMILSFQKTENSFQGAFYFFLAAFFWAFDTNILRFLSNVNPLVVTVWKGAGSTLLLLPLAWSTETFAGSPEIILESLLVGALGYGFSLVVFLRSIRVIGVVQTGAWFGFSPFIGAWLSIVFLKEPLTRSFLFSATILFLAMLALRKGSARQYGMEDASG